MNVLNLVMFCAFLLQTPANPSYAARGQSGRAVGVVISIDSAASQITIKTDAGPELKITCEQGTKFLRVPPGASNLEGATTISLSELTVGDRILARGKSGGDTSSFLASTILIMSKAD